MKKSAPHACRFDGYTTRKTNHKVCVHNLMCQGEVRSKVLSISCTDNGGREKKSTYSHNVEVRVTKKRILVHIYSICKNQQITEQ